MLLSTQVVIAWTSAVAIGTWSHLTWDSPGWEILHCIYGDTCLFEWVYIARQLSALTTLERGQYTSVRYPIVAMLYYIDRVLYETALPCLHLTILILLLISYNRKHISCQCCWSIWTVARLGRVSLPDRHLQGSLAGSHIETELLWLP